MHGMIGKPAAPFKWDDDKIAILRQRRKDNISFSVIGAEFGITRHACIGKAHRLGLCGTKQDCGKPKVIKARAARVVTGAAALPTLTPYLNPNARQRKEVPLEASSLHIDLWSLKNDTCRFPTKTDEEGNQLYCGAAEADLIAAKPYCPHHHAVAFHPPRMGKKPRTNAVLHPSRMAFGG